MAGTPTPPIYDNPAAPRNSSGADAGLLNRYGIAQPGTPPMAPGQGYVNPFRQAQASYLGGFNPGDFLRAHGFSFNEGPSAGTTFSRNGQSYTNVGASHEGGGFGGESQFLQGQGFTPSSSMAGLGDKAYGGQVGMLDKAMAATAQQNLHDKIASLTPADKARMAASGTDIFGNSAFGVNTGHTVPGTVPKHDQPGQNGGIVDNTNTHMPGYRQTRTTNR